MIHLPAFVVRLRRHPVSHATFRHHHHPPSGHTIAAAGACRHQYGGNVHDGARSGTYFWPGVSLQQGFAD